MKLKRLREMGIEVSANPQTASKCVSLEDMKSLLKDGLKAGDDIEFEEWKREDGEECILEQHSSDIASSGCDSQEWRRDVSEFYRWATSQKKSIEYVYYSAEDYESASKELSERNPKPVPGELCGQWSIRIGSSIANEQDAEVNSDSLTESIGSSIANEQDAEVNSESLTERSRRAAP
ncbi:hypothetical protein DPMN_010163 [Dreissena polymorpha]|uniref:Uncharacterized protein n=1 Tax=Dreissena polymorpha TaxID=45954 RepID=A0A9D4MYA8_DREPO|nr:hypothetical protein DPMN_010163 [Dreissena polymorpha]